MADNSTAPTKAADLPKEQLLDMHRSMVLQRRFEEHAGRAYGMGKIYGFCHLYIGQEAISTGCATAMAEQDIMISAYRIHAMALSMGLEPQEVMDELFGKATGNVGGLGGSMHFFEPDKGFWGGWGLVGQQVPMACGVAFAQKHRKTDAVTMAFFGDGALQQGAIHESFNMAAIWNLPIVFVLENNKYGMGTAVERVSALAPDATKMADAYGFESMSFDGMDVTASYDAFTHAIEHARAHQRPFFLEAQCSRFRGHSMSDPGKYRTKEMLQEEKEADPIPKFEAVLIEKGYATAEELKALDMQTKADMKEVLKKAEAAPWPEEDAIYKYTYVDPLTEEAR
ncbi:MAG: pyruvate dehydrogenase E1 component alpha subunit [Bradymonadia bacterium]